MKHKMKIVLVVFVSLGIIQTAAAQHNLPEWLVYPDEEWETVTPEEAGLDAKAINEWARTEHRIGGYTGEKPGAYGAVFTRGGKIVATWGDTEASVTK